VSLAHAGNASRPTSQGADIRVIIRADQSTGFGIRPPACYHRVLYVYAKGESESCDIYSDFKPSRAGRPAPARDVARRPRGPSDISYLSDLNFNSIISRRDLSVASRSFAASRLTLGYAS
jgi:hypothetical protein